jgi:uncharacterized protein (DUF433 family)
MPVGQRQKTQPRATPQLLRTLFPPEIRTGLDPERYWKLSNFGYLWRKLSASGDEIKEAVAMNAEIMHGNPVFRGTRIPIYEIIEELADGTTMTEVLAGYPSLRLEQVQLGLDFAASLLRIYNDQIPD